MPVPKSAVMVLFLANVINDSGDSSLQLMNWLERERNRWRHFLSTKNHPGGHDSFCGAPLALGRSRSGDAYEAREGAEV